MITRQRLYGKSMEIAGNAYIAGIQLLSQLKWINTPSHKRKTIGQGYFHYEIRTDWGQGDREHLPVNNCHEMVIDNEQRIYLLTDHPRNNVIVFNQEGKVQNSWTLNSSGAHGLTITKHQDEEQLLICDPYHPRVVRTKLDGTVISFLPNPKDIGIYTPSMPYAPTQTAVAMNGDIYVADGYGSQYVIQFDDKGNYLRHFGGKGHASHNLNFAHGIAIDSRIQNKSTLLVTSRKDSCIKRFTLQGEYLDEIALPGGFPCRPVIYGEYVLLSLCWSEKHLNPNSGFIIVLDKHNNVCATLGGQAEHDESGKLVHLKSDYSTFNHVHDVCADIDGNLYIAQWNAGKIFPYKLVRIKS